MPAHPMAPPVLFFRQNAALAPHSVPQLGHRHISEMTLPTDPTWIFDPAPPSGSREGGNAAEYSFTGGIDSLVREALQNSLDAKRRDADRVDAVFRVVELEGDHLQRFKGGMAWDSLEDNLRAVPLSRGGLGIEQALQGIDGQKMLRLLVIEDHNTRGLPESEFREDDDSPNSYCALVRDTLYSDKQDKDAGGSYGLGKSLLWAFSGIKSVLFVSRHRDAGGGLESRLIGRTSLPYHRTEDDGPCTGKGWFGVPKPVEPPSRSDVAVSIRGDAADDRAQIVKGSRRSDDTGLTIVIVGLREPGQEDERPSEEILDEIKDEVLTSFWPALTRKKLSVRLELERNGNTLNAEDVDPDGSDNHRTAAQLLRSFDEGSLEEAASIEPGGSAIRHVEVRVPARKVEREHEAMTVRVPVLVHLLEGDEHDCTLRDQIIRFRSRGMVVGRPTEGSLSLTSRPYIAVVAAGKAAGDVAGAAECEQFLRCAEPPAHDCWTSTTGYIKQQYKKGAKSALADFKKECEKAVRELVGVREESGGKLPQRLLAKLRFGASDGGGKPRFMSTTRESAVLKAETGAWQFSGRCKRTEPGDRDWIIDVAVALAGDAGFDKGLRLAALTPQGKEGEDCRVEIHPKGGGRVLVPASIAAVTIKGSTDPAAGPINSTRARLRIAFEGQNGEEL